MNHALAIAGRELRGRTRLFILAIAVAVIPFAATLLPGAAASRADAIAIAGASLGLLLGVGTAIALGNTTIAGELAERRLSFYFSRPISAAALWIGKAVAALVASLGVFLIVCGPAFLAGRIAWNGGMAGARDVLAYGALAIVAFFFVSHALATVVRSRSALLALDLALLAIATGAMYLTLRAVVAAGATLHAAMILIVVLATVFLALVVTPVLQLANGRTDARRSHAAFSRAFWPVVVVAVAGAALYSAWLTTPDVDDIEQVQLLVPAPSSDWVLLGGEMKHRPDYFASFVVNRSTGESMRLPSPLWWGSSFSRDGRTLAWIEAGRVMNVGPFRLLVRRLDQPGAATRDTGILVSGNIVLSDDGSRVAATSGDLLSVYDVASGKLLASAKGPSGEMSWRYFVTNDLVRIYNRGTDGRLTIHELDVRTRSMAKTGELTGTHRAISASADGSRVLFSQEVIADGRTGATLATLPAWSAEQSRPRMLHDGRIARTGLTGNAMHLQLFSAEGQLRHDVVLPGVRSAMVTGSTVDGRAIVVGARQPGRERTTFIVDVATGRVERTVERQSSAWMTGFPDPRDIPHRGELVAVDVKGEVIAYKYNGRAEARPLLK